jgi:hypothetical protein
MSTAIAKPNESSTVPQPSLPAPPSVFDDIYVLRFVFKQHIEEKTFRASGTIQEIVNRAKAHCEQCGYRFLFVKPFLSDFLKDEVKHRASY